jgi:hypothetical protein
MYRIHNAFCRSPIKEMVSATKRYVKIQYLPVYIVYPILAELTSLMKCTGYIMQFAGCPQRNWFLQLKGM